MDFIQIFYLNCRGKKKTLYLQKRYYSLNEDFSQLIISFLFQKPKETLSRSGQTCRRKLSLYIITLTKPTPGEKLWKTAPWNEESLPMLNSKYFLPLFLVFFFSLFSFAFITVKSETAGNVRNGTRDSTRLVYNASVVLEVNSKMGAMANICLSMALSDFYAKHPSYNTRLSLQRWDSLDGLVAASSGKFCSYNFPLKIR